MTRHLENDHADEISRPSDATPPTDLPRLEGFERAGEGVREAVEQDLGERLHPSEVDPRVVRGIRYEDRPDPEGHALGETTMWSDARTGELREADVTVYRHEDLSPDAYEVRATTLHEIGHTVWQRAPRELREAYARDVHDWQEAHSEPQRLEMVDEEGLPVTVWARPVDASVSVHDAEEHFCEAYSEAILDPKRLDFLDWNVPDAHRRQPWVDRIRRSVRADDPKA